VQAETVVRITADCPLIDPVVVDKVVQRFLDGDCDYASNALRYTYPDGLDTEVFSFGALERAWRERQKIRSGSTSPLLAKREFSGRECDNAEPVPAICGGPSTNPPTWNSSAGFFFVCWT